MKKFIYFIIAIALVGCNKAEITPTKNVIVMLGDGVSTSVISAARWYQMYQDSTKRNLNIDPYLSGYITTHLSNSVLACSAPAMSGYMTGVMQQGGNISIHPQSDPAQDIVKVDVSKAFTPASTLLELAKSKDQSVGVVATFDFCHATPAACASHHSYRGAYSELASQMVNADLDVLMGGGSARIKAQDKAYLERMGVEYIQNDVKRFREFKGDAPLCALFTNHEMSYDIDRDDSVEPSLSEMTQKAIEKLSSNKNGFFLMVEGSQIDAAAHGNDLAGTITEFLAFDKAVGVALDFAKKDKNTTVIILTDHGTGGLGYGSRKYKNYSTKGVDSLFNVVTKYQRSAKGLSKILATTPEEQIGDVFAKYTDITLSEDEIATIESSMNRTESDYMKVSDSRNLISTVGSIMLNRTYFDFLSGSHTGEDVFLAVYNPNGDILTGFNNTVSVNNYLCQVMGATQDELYALSDDMFVNHAELFEGATFTIGVIDQRKINELPNVELRDLSTRNRNDVVMLSAELSDGNKLLFTANSSELFVNGKMEKMNGVAVYMKENNAFYLPRDVKAQI